MFTESLLFLTHPLPKGDKDETKLTNTDYKQVLYLSVFINLCVSPLQEH